MALSRLVVIAPAFDELANLRKLLPRVSKALDGVPNLEYQVIAVVEREAPGATLAELATLGARPVVRRPTDSFGDAIRTGIANCPPDTDFVVFMDADGSHDPVTIPRLLDRAGAADVVIASRYVEGGRSDNGPLLRAMSRSLNYTYGLVLGLKCRDISTNFKLFHYRDVSDVTLECTNFDIVEELLFRVRQGKGPAVRIVEIPDYFHERDEGETKRQLGPFVASYLLTLTRLRLRG